MALCDFSHFPKTGNDVINWRGVKKFNRKLQLVGGGKFWPDRPKISFRNRPGYSINSGHTNILQLRFNVTSLTIVGENDLRFTKFKRYIEKQWIRRTPANELSTFNAIQTTNNGAEIYHAKLNSKVVVKQPRIWHFVFVLNNIIADTEIDLERLRNGIEISRPTRKLNIQNAKLRRV